MEDTDKTQTARAGKSADEVALDLMKFIATETGYGKGQGAVGFSGKNAKTPEEYAEALLGLFDRCRKAVKQEPAA
jgi:hypothetical protein